MMLAHTTESIIKLRLPASIDQTTTLNIVAQIRDTFDLVTEFNLTPVTVVPDFIAIRNLINVLQKTDNDLSGDLLIQLLTNGDQNTIGQIITSLSEVFYEMNDETIKNAALSKDLFKTLIKIIVFSLYRWYSDNQDFSNIFE